MKLKDQVCSLKLAKKLKKLGVKQESLFYYQGLLKEIKAEKGFIINFMKVLGAKEIENVSAFTVAELGEWFRDNYPIYIDQETVTVGGFWRIDFGDQQMVTAKTEANARAKMLIYLLENKLLKEGK